VILTYVAQRKIHAVASVEAIPMAQRLANALTSYVGYLVKMFWPFQLTAFYAHPRGGISYATAGLAGAALCAMTAAALYFGTRRRFLRSAGSGISSCSPRSSGSSRGEQARRSVHLSGSSDRSSSWSGAAELLGRLMRHR
jgi:hypothetical protein